MPQKFTFWGHFLGPLLFPQWYTEHFCTYYHFYKHKPILCSILLEAVERKKKLYRQRNIIDDLYLMTY